MGLNIIVVVAVIFEQANSLTIIDNLHPSVVDEEFEGFFACLNDLGDFCLHSARNEMAEGFGELLLDNRGPPGLGEVDDEGFFVGV